MFFIIFRIVYFIRCNNLTLYKMLHLILIESFSCHTLIELLQILHTFVGSPLFLFVAQCLRTHSSVQMFNVLGAMFVW